MKYLVCVCAVFCAAAFCSVALMSEPSESGYAISVAMAQR
jgi:hypothetical protein